MDAYQIAVFGVVNILCFVIGARVGQMATKGERVKLTELNPITAIKEHSEQKQADKQQRKEQERKEAIMHNINMYDGTSNGQREIPRG